MLAITHKILEGAPNYAKYHEVLAKAFAEGSLSIGAAAAIIFGFLALAYCYVASAPITIIHATRMFRGDWFNRLPRYGWLVIFTLLVGLLHISTVVSLKALTPHEPRPIAYLMIFVMALPALWILFAQVLCIMRLHLDEHPSSSWYRRLCLVLTKFRMTELPVEERGQFTRFYSKLAIEREAAPGLRETYTHMREHANSVFIAVFEISLAALIFWILDRSSKDLLVRFGLVATVFFVWIIPNVLLWAQANRLESSLIPLGPAFGTHERSVTDRSAMIANQASPPQ